MIFMHTFDAVMDGSKTRTRRPWRDHWIIQERDGRIHRLIYTNIRGEVIAYEIGQLRSVQRGRGKLGEGFVEIVALNHLEQAGIITPQEALEEGYSSPEAFRKVWEMMHGKGSLERPCLEIRFELVKP